MKPSLILTRLVALAVLSGLSVSAQSHAKSAPSTITFMALPGTNTLIQALCGR
jgi:ABC-type phosphate/phosphonate transport system substrate-binding protein